jgi:hypothetical protein
MYSRRMGQSALAEIKGQNPRARLQARQPSKRYVSRLEKKRRHEPRQAAGDRRERPGVGASLTAREGAAYR